MSQLNKKTVIISIIIGFLVIGASIGITLLILNRPPEQNTDEDHFIAWAESNTTTEAPDFVGLDYYSFYDENDLKVNREHGVPVISGLKDESVEKKINNSLKEISDSGHDELQVALNAFNILSVNEHKWLQEDTYRDYSLNYDLRTGDQITFDQLFSSNANKLSIIADGFYSSLSTDISLALRTVNRTIEEYESHTCGMYYCEGDNININEVKEKQKLYADMLANMDEVAYSRAKKFLARTDKIDFYLTNYAIYFKDNEDIIKIDAKKHSKMFAYYNRFQTTDSIYDNDDGKKHMFLSAQMNQYMENYGNRQVGDYAFIEWNFASDLEDWQLDYINNELESKIAQLDKNQFTYFRFEDVFNSNGAFCRHGDYVCIASLSSVSLEMTMTKDYWSSNFLKLLFDAKDKTITGDAVIVPDCNELEQVTCIEHEYGYDGGYVFFDTDHRAYSEAKDIFKSDYDFQTYLTGIFYGDRNRLYGETYSMEEKQKHHFNYEIKHDGIKIILNENRDKTTTARFSSIPSEIMNEKLLFKK